MKMHVFTMQLTSNEARKCEGFHCASTRNYLLPILITSADGKKYLLAHGSKQGTIGIGNINCTFIRLADFYGSMIAGQELNVISCFGGYYTDIYDSINDISIRQIFKTMHTLYAFFNTYQLLVLTQDEMQEIPDEFEYHGLREYDPDKNTVEGFDELTLLKNI